MSLPRLILGNSNRRFSGVTSTMLQTLPEVRKRMPLAVLGKHHLPPDVPIVKIRDLISRKDEKPQLFHARRNNEMLQALLARRLGANLKIVFTSTAQRHHTRFTKWLMSKMDGIITTSNAANFYLEKSADVIIPHGVDLARYHPPDDRLATWKELGLPGKYGIGIFGRVRAQKGVDLLIDAALPLMKTNPDPTLVIVGETTPKFQDYQNKLTEKVAKAGLENRVVFMGKQPSERLPELIRAMTLVTALSRNEGFGLTILEAMASSCAVLASHAGAWKDIVEVGVHGSLVECDDLAATSRELEGLLARSPDDLIEMGRRGRAHVEKNYAIEGEAKSLVQYYQSVLDGDSR